ncbi:MAG: hypothetical protein ACOCOZ_08230, partial [Prevotella sp.]
FPSFSDFRTVVHAVHDHIVFPCSDCRYFASDHIAVDAALSQHLAGEDFERFFWNPLSGTKNTIDYAKRKSVPCWNILSET